MLKLRQLTQWLCRLLGCPDCEEERQALSKCRESKANLELALQIANETIRQLKLLVPRPVPPKVTDVIKQGTVFIQSALDRMKLGIIRIPLDETYYMANQSDFLNVVAWDWVDTLDWTKDRWDCENFAFVFKSHVDLFFGLNQVGIVIDYVSRHSYNLVVYPDGKVQILEPQSDALYVWTQRPGAFYSLKGAIVLI